MCRKSLLMAVRLARGEQESWDLFSFALRENLGCSCLDRRGVRAVFQQFLRRLLKGVIAFAAKTQHAVDKLEAQLLVTKAALRHEKQARKRACSRAKRTKLQEDLNATCCSICFTGSDLAVITPCGHACVCEGCAAAVTQCPVCRAAVQAAYRLYL